MAQVVQSEDPLPDGLLDQFSVFSWLLFDVNDCRVDEEWEEK